MLQQYQNHITFTPFYFKIQNNNDRITLKIKITFFKYNLGNHNECISICLYNGAFIKKLKG